MNVIMIVADALRKDFLGCYGFPLYNISHIVDFLASRSTLFTNATADGRTAYSISRLITSSGTYESIEVDIKYNKEYPLFPEILNKHNINYWLATSNGIVNKSLKEGGWNDSKISYFAGRQEMEGDAVVEAANSALSRLEEPFFLLVWFDTVHDYYLLDIYTEQWEEEYHNNDYFKNKEHKYRVRYAQYMTSISKLDKKLGKLLFHSDDYDCAEDNTAVIFTADHGELLGPRHTTNLNFTHRAGLASDLPAVPLLIYPSKKYQTGAICSANTNWIDLPPTICKLLEIDYPNKWQGKDLSKYLFKPDDFAEAKKRLEGLGYI